VDSSTVRYVEQLQPWDWGTDDADVFFVDSGLTWDGGDAVDITNVTQADPAVVTVDSWPTDGDGTNLADGDQVKILTVVGMTELNGNIYTVDDASVTGLTFSLDNSAGTANIDSTAYTEYSSSGTVQRFESSFSGFDHLEGETLAVCVDGAADPNVTVSSGAFTTQTWTNKLCAGLAYTSRLETVPITFETQEGSIISRKKQIGEVAVNFYKTLGTYWGVEGDVDEIPFGQTTLFTDWIPLSFQHGTTRDALIYIQQTEALPLCVRGIEVKVEVLD